MAWRRGSLGQAWGVGESVTAEKRRWQSWEKDHVRPRRKEVYWEANLSGIQSKGPGLGPVHILNGGHVTG